jgi:pterin-4a-carbinolamine dehydratase
LIWSTHDAGGITELDFELAEKCDALARATGERAS